MKKIIRSLMCVLLAAVIVCSFAGCANSEIKGVISDFESACNDLDFNAMSDCINPRITGVLDFASGLIGMFTEKDTEEMLDKKLASGHLDYYYTVDQNFVFTWNDSTNTYDMTYINQINALWEAALASFDEGSEEWHHVKKSMIHWTYIELYNTMDNRYKYGTAEEKAELVARNEALYNDMKTYGITRLFDNSHDLIEVTDFTKSPHQDSGDWFNEKWTVGDLIC